MIGTIITPTHRRRNWSRTWRSNLPKGLQTASGRPEIQSQAVWLQSLASKSFVPEPHHGTSRSAHTWFWQTYLLYHFKYSIIQTLFSTLHVWENISLKKSYSNWPKITTALNMTQNTALTEICILIHCPVLSTASNKWRKPSSLMNFLCHKVWKYHMVTEFQSWKGASSPTHSFYEWRMETQREQK